MKIAHIADVHWRGLSRHNEYVKVFEDFATKCRTDKVDHIFVGGDIFHTKTSGISPEYVDVLAWWLATLSDVATVHLTLGNHDGNLVNLSRQDAVTPIVRALNNQNVKVYKSSGTYPFAPGFNWCIFSLFDEPGWKNVRAHPGDVNIACYHGPVKGAVTETNWEIDDGITIDFFADYDFVFLGDLHKKQFLGYRDVELTVTEDELAAYPTADIIEEFVEE